MGNDQEEMTLDIGEIFEVIKKRKKIILIITLLSVIIASGLSFFVIAPTYESKISIVIGKTPSGDKKQDEYSDIMMYQNLVKTYAKIAQSRVVAQETIDTLGLDVDAEILQKQVTITPQADTQIIEIKVQNKSPQDAMNIVNTLSETFIEESKRIYPDGNVQVIDKAVLPENPVKPNKKINIAISFFLGIMVSLGLAFLLEYMDNTIKTESDIERYLGIPVIGIIPKNNEK